MACSNAYNKEDEIISNDDDGAEMEWVLARHGINLIVNNKHEEAEALFLKYPNSLIMFSGYSFAIFMDALMSFEEDKLSKAILVLKEVEKRCTGQNGWLKSFSSRVFGSGNENTISLAQELETQIILADSQVCMATLMFLQQDLSGYFKGGWVLRKAWKVYQKTYKEILTLYRETIGELHLPDPVKTPSPTPLSPASSIDCSSNNDDIDDMSSIQWDFPEVTVNGKGQTIDRKTLVRLMGAISFGHGLFQLGVSLLPPSLTRIVSLFGFEANRQNGISCLMYARLGMDMRAPLARLALLWYHTIVRPFYAIDGTNVEAGADSAAVLIQESKIEFGNSALFLFFSGRTCRLKSDISEALSSFQKAKENAKQREIKILSLHEIGWCYLIKLDYENAKNSFMYLKNASRWSRAFYGYLGAICIGASQDFCSYNIFNELHSVGGSTKGGQLDEFLQRRLQCCPKNAESAKKCHAVFFKLFIFEMLYLWNALASCNRESVNKIILECEHSDADKNEPRNGLANLIVGSCYLLLRNIQEATNHFKKCLEKRIDELPNADDAHISAFAQQELGYILLQKEETKEEGKTLLEQVSKYTRYDFEGRLNVRIHNILKHL